MGPIGRTESRNLLHGMTLAVLALHGGLGGKGDGVHHGPGRAGSAHGAVPPLPRDGRGPVDGNTNWRTDEPLDTWHGLGTDDQGRITGLCLMWNGLVGSIPPQLRDLQNLNELDLWDNGLTGSIPPELGDLLSLVTLYLDNNGLTGSIPPE